MKCLCGKIKTTRLFQSGLFDVIKCSSCGQVRIETRDGAKRTGYYEEEDVKFYLSHQEMFRRLFGNLLRFIHRYAPSGTLMDIGAGVGLLLDEARNMGYRVIGFEPSKASVKAAKKYFGIELIPREFHKTLKNMNSNIDIVVINHVLEHLKNPKEIIGLCAETLSDTGVLVIGVPNFNSFMRWMKQGKWQSLIPAQHRWQFTLASLDELVLPHGFRRIAVSYENHDRSMHYWWKKPIYAALDRIALVTGHAEAMVVIYKKI
ncbi:MAG: class I SAM-dependent methyltransferase [Candidatus Gottesmanbacteria bacterium]|nr:class I SAM-dependent methyltransferase [Candidatus Gottesmanbacteria bacterium]